MRGKQLSTICKQDCWKRNSHENDATCHHIGAFNMVLGSHGIILLCNHRFQHPIRSPGFLSLSLPPNTPNTQRFFHCSVRTQLRGDIQVWSRAFLGVRKNLLTLWQLVLWDCGQLGSETKIPQETSQVFHFGIPTRWVPTSYEWSYGRVVKWVSLGVTGYPPGSEHAACRCFILRFWDPNTVHGFRNQAINSWGCKYPIIYKVSVPSQVVHDFFHQQYVCRIPNFFGDSHLLMVMNLSIS